ncbi:hypothetical protein ACN26Z_18390 [Verrucosispora sp. WMMD703]|uniref:hypothetical protein n=1 Tax=Verrucosispora sp. WMMD703 TaxID=3403463 RepID=UPI003B94557C
MFELKGGNGVRVNHALEQLQKGAEVADKLNPKTSTEFSAYLVKKSLSAIQIRQLRRATVRYRGKSYSIKLINCGQSVDLLR